MTTAAPTIIRKTTTAETKVLDEAKGIVQAVVNSLDVVDHDDEVLASGAFDASIAKGLPAVAWMHDQSKIVGGVTEAKEDKKKLIATMQFDLDTEPGAYAFKMVSRGRVKEWSVGFYVSGWRMEERDHKSVRVLDAVEWVEVSPVLKGASPGTMTVDAKKRDTTTSAPATSPNADAAGTDPWTDGAKAAIARFRADIIAAGIIPPPAPETKAGRTMSSRNLDQLHSALTGLAGLHGTTCDMGEGCPLVAPAE